MALAAKMNTRVIAGRRMAMAAPRAIASVRSAVRPSFAQEAGLAAAPAMAMRSSRSTRVVRVEAVKKSVGDLTKADLEGKRVLVRADLNVPLDKALNITDDTRIRAAIPTLKYLLDNGAKVLLTSHLVSALGSSIRPGAERVQDMGSTAPGLVAHAGHGMGRKSSFQSHGGDSIRHPLVAHPLLHAAHANVQQGRPKGENKEEDKKKYSLAPVVGRLSELLGKPVSASFSQQHSTQHSLRYACSAAAFGDAKRQESCDLPRPSTLLHAQVQLVDDCIGQKVTDAVNSIGNGSVSLLAPQRESCHTELGPPR